MNIAFMASYNGSSAHAITDACLNGDIIGAASLLITNNPQAKALEWAENKGLKTTCLNSKSHPDPADLDYAIAEKLRDQKITLLVLSGYMKLIGPRTIDAVNGRIINVHPALLPKYGGQGMYGNHVHQAVKNNGDSETGATIHVVNDKYDDGQILAQKLVSISPSDSVNDIAEKVKAIEPELYIDTVRKILKGDITLS